jgi:hypothetical protein
MRTIHGSRPAKRSGVPGPLFLIAALLVAIVNGQAVQDGFVIASWWDPDLTGKTTLDEARLAQFRNAHFNTLTGLNARSSNGMLEDAPARFPGVRYKLERIAKVPGLRLMVLDWLYWTNMNGDVSSIAGSAIAKYNALPLSLANRVAGYNIWDEPQPGRKLDRVKSLISTFTAGDTRRIAWANLTPYNQSTFPAWLTYVDYVRSYLAAIGAKVASFDYYPFLTSGKWRNFRFDPKDPPFYYRNLGLFAVETRARGATFWAFPLSSQHLDYAPITQVNLQFMAFAPLVYGAKGLVYYTYQWCREDTTMKSAIVDSNGDTTRIYSWAKRINQQVETLGPLLMTLVWQGTYHESQTDTGYAGCSFEPGLAEVPLSHPLIKSISSTSHSGMIGDFRAGSALYLLLFNKDRNSPHDFLVTFKKPVPVRKWDKTMGTWSRRAGSTTSLAIPAIEPADLLVLKLAD